jgi:hypothetical protein
LVTEDEKMTLVPLQIVVAEAAIIMDAALFEETVMAILLLLAVDEVTQFSLLVNTHVITSLFTSAASV